MRGRARAAFIEPIIRSRSRISSAQRTNIEDEASERGSAGRQTTITRGPEMKKHGKAKAAAMASCGCEDVGATNVYGADEAAGGTANGVFGNGHPAHALNDGGGGDMMPNDGQQAAGDPEERGMPGLLAMPRSGRRPSDRRWSAHDSCSRAR